MTTPSLTLHKSERHTKTLIQPTSLPKRGEVIQQEDHRGVLHAWTVLGVIPVSYPATLTTSLVFLSRSGSRSVYVARFHEDGDLAGLGDIEPASVYAIPTEVFRQLSVWKGSGGFLRSLRSYLLNIDCQLDKA